jgi:hypothetical protein
MGQVLRIGEQSRSAATMVHFERTELCRLFALYSSRVADGEWRDYAIAQRPGRAVFAVFRHTLEQPLFTISKIAGPGRSSDWEVTRGPRPLCHADTLEEALHLFDRSLRLIAH